MTRLVPTVKALVDWFRAGWKSFLLIHISVNLIILIVLAPLTVLALNFAVSFSGGAALSDLDIV